MTASIQPFAIGEVSIRQQDGLFSLNDLHRASGGEAKHQPALFLRLDQTQALVSEISSSTDSQSLAVKKVLGKGKAQGTYACRELVIAYAAWINPAFHLKVIRVFLDAMQPPATLSTEQAYEVKTAVEAKCMGSGAKFRTLYTAMYRHFRVSRYRDIAASDFERALAFIEQWQPPRGFDAGITYDRPSQLPPPVVPHNPMGERMRWEITDDGNGNVRCRLLDADHHLIKYKNLPRIISDPNSELPYIVIRELLDACVDRMEQIITNSNAACDLLRTQLRRERGLN